VLVVSNEFFIVPGTNSLAAGGSFNAEPLLSGSPAACASPKLRARLKSIT
jgi:hypothetical protein